MARTNTIDSLCFFVVLGKMDGQEEEEEEN